jgi:hypothetical protein
MRIAAVLMVALSLGMCDSDEGREKYEVSKAAYQYCLKVQLAASVCEPERAIMEADSRAYGSAKCR